MFHLENDSQVTEDFFPNRHVCIQFNHNSFVLKILLPQDEKITESALIQQFHSTNCY